MACFRFRRRWCSDVSGQCGRKEQGGKGFSMQRWQIKGMPTTVILNSQGEMLHHIIGERAWDSPEILTQIRAVKPQTGNSAFESD